MLCLSPNSKGLPRSSLLRKNILLSLTLTVFGIVEIAQSTALVDSFFFEYEECVVPPWTHSKTSTLYKIKTELQDSIEALRRSPPHSLSAFISLMPDIQVIVSWSGSGREITRASVSLDGITQWLIELVIRMQRHAHSLIPPWTSASPATRRWTRRWWWKLWLQWRSVEIFYGK